MLRWIDVWARYTQREHRASPLHVTIPLMKHRLFVAVLLISTLACRPVLTIGWTEILIILGLLALLLGPALYKIYQRINEFQNWKKSKNKK